MNICRRLLSSSMVSYNGFDPNICKLIDQLDKLAPRFELSKGQIKVLTDPKEFYQTLKTKISNAKERVFLSSLYIGKAEHDLIDCISDALNKNPQLKVYILTDALRGTREAPSKSSASLLAQLIKDHKNRVDIRMYHTPNLHGLSKKIIPKRFNEGFGLQHMKIYGFDEEVILSGANLSSDYFTNRQDRYFLFNSSPLADFYFNIQKTIGSLSYKLAFADNKEKFKLVWPSSNPAPDPLLDSKSYIQSSSKILKDLFDNRVYPVASKKNNSEPLTYVFPVSQFTPLLKPDYSNERPSISKLLAYSNNKNVKWTFTAGYFNMLPEIKKGLIKSSSKGNVITASTFANGFFESKGVSKYLPDAYLYLSKIFLQDVTRNSRENDITLFEWQKGVVNTRDGWSYHAKGFWVTAPGEDKPSITIVGSSNYTRRSYSYDLETNAIVVTKDEELKAEMDGELSNIMRHTSPVKLSDFKNSDRKISKGVILATKILGNRL